MFLGRITRNLAFDRYRKSRAKRRIRGSAILALSELEECIPSGTSEDAVVDSMALCAALNSFLRSLAEEDMKMFVRRYWFGFSVADISKERGIGHGNVKIRLHRMRLELKKCLEREGIFI